MAIFGGFLGRKTVDGIMIGFSRVLDDLAEVIEARTEENRRLHARVLEIEHRSDANKDEIWQAEHIVRQLRAIMTPSRKDDEIPF
jgi:hypothetical protein